MKNLFFIPFDQGADIVGAHKGVYEIFNLLKVNKTLDKANSFTWFYRDSVVQQIGDTGELENIKEEVIKFLTLNHKIFTVSGDHSVTYYLYQMVSEYFNEALPLIVFDAHSDASREYDNWINHGCFIRELIKKVQPEIYHIGVRYDPIKLRGIEQLTFPSFSFLSEDTYVEDIIKSKIGDRRCYVSIDIDVLDPRESPGVYFPVAGGLMRDELYRMLDSIFKLNIVATDLVEYAPDKDEGKKTLQAAVKIVEKWLEV